MAAIENESAFAYLVVGLFWPWAPYGPPPDLAAQLGATSIALPERTRLQSARAEITPAQLCFAGDEPQRPTWYYRIDFDGGAIDDVGAVKIAEALAATISISYRLGVAPEDIGAVRVPASMLEARVEWDQVAAAARVAPSGDFAYPEQLRSYFGTGVAMGPDGIREVLRVLPCSVQAPFDAATQYYAASIRDFLVPYGDVGEVLAERASQPIRVDDRTRCEQALQNAFKAVEAIIGEPPSDDRRLRQKLEQAGIDPDKLAGWPHTEKDSSASRFVASTGPATSRPPTPKCLARDR